MTDRDMLTFSAWVVAGILYGGYKFASWLEHRHESETALSKRLREAECRDIELPEPKAGWGKKAWKVVK